MIAFQAREVRLHCHCDLWRILDRKEMPYNRGIVFCLSRQSQGRIALFGNLSVSHDLYDLRRLRKWLNRYGTGNLPIHERRAGVMELEKSVLQRTNVFTVRGIGPYPSYFPDVDLAIGDDVRSR